jgi:hypothetical protein
MEVFGVFVVKNKNGYTSPARQLADSSQYEILLTDIDSLPSDLPKYPLRKIGDKKIQKNINKIRKDMSKVREDMSDTRERVRNLERKDSLKMLIIGLLSGSLITLLLTLLLNKINN